MSEKSISKMLFSNQEPQKIELGFAQDLIATHKEVVSQMQDIDKMKSKAKQNANKFVDIYKQYVRAVGEIGFDPNPRAAKLNQEIEQILKDLR